MKSTFLSSMLLLSGLNSEPQYESDGEPRIPEIGEIIKIADKFTRVISAMTTKRQIYRKII